MFYISENERLLLAFDLVTMNSIFAAYGRDEAAEREEEEELEMSDNLLRRARNSYNPSRFYHGTRRPLPPGIVGPVIDNNSKDVHDRTPRWPKGERKRRCQSLAITVFCTLLLLFVLFLLLGLLIWDAPGPSYSPPYHGGSGSSSQFASASLTFNLDYSSLNHSQFIYEFQVAVSTPLGILYEQIYVDDLSAGSVVVHWFFVDPNPLFPIAKRFIALYNNSTSPLRQSSLFLNSLSNASAALNATQLVSYNGTCSVCSTILTQIFSSSSSSSSTGGSEVSSSSIPSSSSSTVHSSSSSSSSLSAGGIPSSSSSTTTGSSSSSSFSTGTNGGGGISQFSSSTLWSSSSSSSSSTATNVATSIGSSSSSSSTGSTPSVNGPSQMNLTYNGLTIQVDAWGADSVRIRAGTTPIIQTPDYQALSATPPSNYTGTYNVTTLPANFTNGNIQVNLAPPPASSGSVGYNNVSLTILRVSDGAILIHNTVIPTLIYWKDPSTTFYGPKRPYPLYSFNFTYDHGQIGRVYGFGQHHTGQLPYSVFNRYVQYSTSYVIYNGGDISLPIYVSSNQFAFIWNQAGYGAVQQLSNATWSWFTNAGCQFDIWISTVGASVMNTNHVYYDLSRKASAAIGNRPNPLPPWASGTWQSRQRYARADILQSMITEYASYGQRFDLASIDFYNWQTYQGDFVMNSCYNNVSAVQALAASLFAPYTAPNGVNHTEGRFYASTWPNIQAGAIHYNDFATAKYLTYISDGLLAAGTGSSSIYDPYQPGSRQLYWNLTFAGYYLAHGIKAFWLDGDEPQSAPIFNQYWNGRPDVEHGMLFPHMHQRTIYEGALSNSSAYPNGAQDIITLSRSTFLGNATNSVVWNGDTQSTFSFLQIAVMEAQNTALSGIYWWTTDTGGFEGGAPGNAVFEQLYVRWAQFSVFTAIFRYHGQRGFSSFEPPLAQVECAANLGTTLPGGETAFFNTLNPSIHMSLMAMRESMRTYVLQWLNYSSTDGIPIVRPMFYAYPTDPETYRTHDQYMFGPLYLVAPVLVYEAHVRNVYLPVSPGTTWQYYYNQSIIYNGGQYVQMNTTLITQFPLFLTSTLPATVSNTATVTVVPPYIYIPLRGNYSDVLGYATPGTITSPGDANFVDNGQGRGTALYVQNYGSFSVAYNQALPPTSWTVSMWLNIYGNMTARLSNGLNPTYVYTILSSQQSYANNTRTLLFKVGSGFPNSNVFELFGISCQVGTAQTAMFTLTPPGQEWVQFTMAWNSSITTNGVNNFYTYLNGQLVAQSYFNPANMAAGQIPNFALGGYWNMGDGTQGTAASFLGYMQDVNIYNYTMSSPQVLQVFLNEKV
jgi:alpha-D-xyloside xylohydrolase